MSAVELAARRDNVLGEGVCWVAPSRRLYWVDIKGRRLEWLSPGDGASGAWELDTQPSAVAPCADGTLLVATDRGLGKFDPETGELDIRLELEPDRPGNRCNDGGLDMQGRFWIGTMDDEIARMSGALYRVEPDWTATRMVDDLGIPNTTAVSPDGRTFYLADSHAHLIWGYDLDLETGALGYRHIFADTRGETASPDGSAVDEDGFVWNAHWGASRVVRYAPDGQVDRVIELPVSQPTKCAFGGPDLSTLYITTARLDLSEEALAAEPLAGSVFSLRTDVRGFATPPFAG